MRSDSRENDSIVTGVACPQRAPTKLMAACEQRGRNLVRQKSQVKRGRARSRAGPGGVRNERRPVSSPAEQLKPAARPQEQVIGKVAAFQNNPCLNGAEGHCLPKPLDSCSTCCVLQVTWKLTQLTWEETPPSRTLNLQ